MIKFETFYIQCPRCHSWMEGHILKSSMINQSILYSDGKILNDGYITESQKVMICPACSHWSWIEEYNEPVISWMKPSGFYYTWNSWRFYGVHFGSNEGRMALVNHYRDFLEKSDTDVDKEIYFRRLMWWAYNDLIRDLYQTDIHHIISKEMSFNVWKKNRAKLLNGYKLFREHREDYLENLRILVKLLENRYTDDDEEFEATALDIIEIYRQLGNFDKAEELINKTTRRTYFIASIEKRISAKDDLVFLVTG